MKLIVGLGNPGKQYEQTRHNAGFRVIDAIAAEWKLKVSDKKFQALIAVENINGEKVMLMKPQTYMNLSGDALIQAVNYYKIDKKDILVIYDDMDLAIGTIRLREKGSSGGQKGMKHIIECLHSDEINRIRVGIGKNKQIDTVDYVLGKIQGEDAALHQASIEKAKDAAVYSITHTFDETMNRFNKKDSQK